MKRKFLILGIVILSMVIMLLGACAGTTAKGTMQVYVTDALPNGVTAVEIKASNIEAHMAGAADDQWVSLLKNPAVFDLVKVSGVNYLLGTSDVAAGKYTQIRLDITDVTVTLNGKQVKATVPSDKLKLVGDITVEEGKKTSISLDFDGEKSVVLESDGKVSLKPVVKLIVAKPGEILETPVAGTTATSTAALFIKISEPVDESVTGNSTLTIKGQTLPGADVSINADIVSVDSNGNFSQQVTLAAGPNVFDVTATNDQGDETSTEVVVSFVP
jgi:predicted thioesterase